MDPAVDSGCDDIITGVVSVLEWPPFTMVEVKIVFILPAGVRIVRIVAPLAKNVAVSWIFTLVHFLIHRRRDVVINNTLVIMDSTVVGEN